MTVHVEPKRRLGRGLSSLIGEPVAVAVTIPSAVAPAAQEPPRPAAGVEMIDAARVVPNRFQPRREMDEAGLERLADSIRRAGLMQPVIVRPSGQPGAYELVAGERRWRAAQRAGLTRIPAVVRALDDAGAAEWALVENLQREDLNSMDRAHALRSLCERFGVSHAEAADRVGLDRSTVANLIRLTDLEPEIADLVRAARLSAGHGKALLSAPAGPARIALARSAAEHAWTVRRLEHAAAAAGRAGAPVRPAAEPASARAAARADVERRLSDHLGTRVLIRTSRTGTRGRITLRFYDLDHFDALMAKLGLPAEG